MRKKLFDRMASDLSIAKPVSGGAIEGVTARPVALPAKGQIKRYILTSAQNNTDVNGHLWKDWDYAKGPSSWTHSHIVTYPNGQRTIITLYAGKWRAS